MNQYPLSIYALLIPCTFSLRAMSAETVQPRSLPGTADATQTPAQLEAAKHYDRGVELYQAADYALALAEFERAYELTKNYRILYNIGNVQFQLASYARARDAFERYLHDGGAEIPEARQAQVRKDLADLAIRTAKLTIAINEAGADVRIDGHLIGQSPLGGAELVDGGTRRISVSKPGFVTNEQELRVVGGDERTVKIVLTRAIVSKAPDNAVSTGQWVGWGITGALFAGTVVSGVLWSAADSKLTDLKNSASTRNERDDQARTVNTYFWTTAGLGVATLAAGGTMLYFTLKSPGADKQSLMLQPTAGGLLLRGSF